jgi:hypothetical protein
VPVFEPLRRNGPGSRDGRNQGKIESDFSLGDGGTYAYSSAFPAFSVSTDDFERKKDAAWANLCRAEGWVCRVCGSVPERGQRFTHDLCDDCRKIVRNE